jgi:hypothetical protein
MKTFIVFVAFLGLAGFSVWQHMTISSLNERIASRTPQVTSRAIPKSRSDLKKIICPLCHGEKTVAYTPLGRDLLHKETQACPVCLGVGYRMLKVPVGYQLCPDCHGMGIVYDDRRPMGKRIRSDNCGRCGATGLVPSIKQ